MVKTYYKDLLLGNIYITNSNMILSVLPFYLKPIQDINSPV
jgi:hypothetical protein